MPTLTPKLTTRTPGTNYSTDPVNATAAGDSWLNSGRETFWINNGGGSAITLTLVFGTTATVDGVQAPNRTFSVAAGVAMRFGPFNPNIYNDPSNNMNVQYSSVTSVKVLVEANGP